jgi:hypothetical protein
MHLRIAIERCAESVGVERRHPLVARIASQVNDDPVKTYKWARASRMPGRPTCGECDASKTRPAKLLAVFIVDTKDEQLTTPLQK